MNTISKKKGSWLSVFSGILYGLLGYFGVVLMRDGFSVANLSFWRFIVAFLFIALIFLFKKDKTNNSPKDLLKAFINGAIFYCAPAFLFFMAIKKIGSGQAMVVFYVYPAFVMILNWLFLGQKLKPYYILCFAIIISGLIFLVDVGEVSFDLIGIGLSLMAAFLYAIYVFLSKKSPLSPLSSTLMISLVCVLSSFIFAYLEQTLVIPYTLEQWGNIFAIALICSAIPILLLLEATKHISADKASILSVTEPICTVIVGFLLLNEIIRINTIVGIIMTLIGALSIMIDYKKILKFIFSK